MAIVSYCDEKSICYTKAFLENVLYPFLKQFKGLNLKEIIIQTEIKIRGYSPLDKIKETYEIDNIIYQMPQILNV